MGLFFSKFVTFVVCIILFVFFAAGADPHMLNFRGEGTGDGVTKAVLEQAMQIMVADNAYWRPGLDENYYSLIPRMETSPSQCIKIKSYASLIMIAMFYQISPDPVSPFLLATLLEGDDILYDSSFMMAVAPLTQPLFAHWLTQDLLLPNHPSNLSLLSNLLIEVCISKVTDV
jgi:hypothetical protein